MLPPLNLSPSRHHAWPPFLSSTSFITHHSHQDALTRSCGFSLAWICFSWERGTPLTKRNALKPPGILIFTITVRFCPKWSIKLDYVDTFWCLKDELWGLTLNLTVLIQKTKWNLKVVGLVRISCTCRTGDFETILIRNCQLFQSWCFWLM